ncbi:unnamed protein product [Parascedosporium putredinis]|uniref:Peptide hydrolase n=1 Tax=Parascedosporium putredinis TaxID=1442378 RepID=A0A9P1MDP2_9PEZI|nr:unnamed protein product [Parascedosporium putredinis]CAI8003014.1 unnamed protein product [Parascedosporium putredinis]
MTSVAQATTTAFGPSRGRKPHCFMSNPAAQAFSPVRVHCALFKVLHIRADSQLEAQCSGAGSRSIADLCRLPWTGEEWKNVVLQPSAIREGKIEIEKEITTSSLKQTLTDLDGIAQRNDGNRAFGLPGYKASVDYIREQVEDGLKDSFDTWIQPFNHTFEQTRRIRVTGPNGGTVYALSVMYNPPTPEEGIKALMIDTPSTTKLVSSMCTEADWEGIDATGKIPLIKRGICALSEKLILARAHGAVAVIIYNQEPGDTYQSATLGSENRDKVLPMAIIRLEIANYWKESLQGPGNPNLYTKEGDPDNVIFLGAHLDSVQEGPGINDDGSGTAGILEIARSFAKHPGIKNKVRFGWWGAEESGLVGSLYYTSQLSSEEADKIRYYFNYDMIGSPNPAYVVYDGEEIGSQKLFDYLKAAEKPVEFGGFGSSSDYVGFLDLACDHIGNIHWDALTLNTKAAGRVAAEFAASLEGIPSRNVSTTPARSKRGDMALLKWETALAQVQAVRPCAHQHDHDNLY